MINFSSIFETGYGEEAIKNIFLLIDIRFLTRDPNVLSLIQGYPCDSKTREIDSINNQLFNSFLNHIQNVIGDTNIELFE
jgi:hypothetical protein